MLYSSEELDEHESLVEGAFPSLGKSLSGSIRDMMIVMGSFSGRLNAGVRTMNYMRVKTFFSDMDFY